MDFAWYVKTVLVQIKAGIDSANSENGNFRVGYPASVGITYQGVAFTCPFEQPKRESSEETCWFVELRERGEFVGWWAGNSWEWRTQDPNKAKRFTRREAEEVAKALSFAHFPFKWSQWTATEHIFMANEIEDGAGK